MREIELDKAVKMDVSFEGRANVLIGVTRTLDSTATTSGGIATNLAEYVPWVASTYAAIGFDCIAGHKPGLDSSTLSGFPRFHIQNCS